MALHPSLRFREIGFKDLSDAFSLLETFVGSRMANKIHDGTASSFLDATVNLGDKPSRDSINTLLSSFCHLDQHQQDEVMESPKVTKPAAPGEKNGR